MAATVSSSGQSVIHAPTLPGDATPRPRSERDQLRQSATVAAALLLFGAIIVGAGIVFVRQARSRSAAKSDAKEPGV